MSVEPHRIWEGSWNFGDLRSHVFVVDGGDTGQEAKIGHKHEYDHMMVIRASRKPEGANAEPSVVAWLPEGRTKLRAQPGDGYYVRAGVQHTIDVPPGWVVSATEADRR